jgi:RNA-directed DNA polymerase
MLAALKSGVKGGRWYSLMDKVYSPGNLEAAWKKVRENQGAAGVDGESVQAFERHAEENLEQLHDWLKTDRYRPSAVRRVWIPKPGTTKQRPLGIPCVKDRVVQTALRNVLEPIFEARFVDQSYGFRPGRSCKDALRRVDGLLKAGYTWVVDADIEGFFDAIDPDILLEELRREVADGAVLRLIEAYLKQQVMEGSKAWNPVRGTPQGAVISPLLANVYLHAVDEALVGAGLELVRYADDLVILCRSREEAEAALAVLAEVLRGRKLTLHPVKTRVRSWEEGFEFLGYRFQAGQRWPRRSSVVGLKDKIRTRTRRTNGHSLEMIVTQLNPVIRGWYAYYRHVHPRMFRELDGWIRGRLRSILRRRAGKRGRGRGSDHQRWKISFFVERGLFTMALAHAATSQSRTR